MMEFLQASILGIPVGHLFLIWSAILLAALLRAFTGFGFALAAVPVFAFFLTPGQAVVLSASLALGIGIVTGRGFWRDVPREAMKPLVAMAVPGTVLGALLLVQMSPRHFQLWIGLAVITACVMLSFYHPSGYRSRPVVGGLAGLASGLLNGAFAIPGPPVIVYAMATEPMPERVRALLLAYFTLCALMALVSYAGAGLVNLHSLWLFLLAFPAMVIGDRVGTELFRRYGSDLHRRVAVLTLFVIGLAATGRALLA
jgi:uncharacterized membrane protein YfcA